MVGRSGPRGRPQKRQPGTGGEEAGAWAGASSPPCSTPSAAAAAAAAAATAAAPPATPSCRYLRLQARQDHCLCSHSSREAGQRATAAPAILASVAAATPLPATATGASNRLLVSRAGMLLPAGSSSPACRYTLQAGERGSGDTVSISAAFGPQPAGQASICFQAGRFSRALLRIQVGRRRALAWRPGAASLTAAGCLAHSV